MGLNDECWVATIVTVASYRALQHKQQALDPWWRWDGTGGIDRSHYFGRLGLNNLIFDLSLGLRQPIT